MAVTTKAATYTENCDLPAVQVFADVCLFPFLVSMRRRGLSSVAVPETSRNPESAMTEGKELLRLFDEDQHIGQIENG